MFLCKYHIKIHNSLSDIKVDNWDKVREISNTYKSPSFGDTPCDRCEFKYIFTCVIALVFTYLRKHVFGKPVYIIVVCFLATYHALIN